MSPNLSERIRRVAAVVLALIIVGVFLWAVNIYIPMAQSIKDILNIVVVIATCVFVLQGLGLWPAVVRMWNDLTGRVLRPPRRV
ncbi:MAG TPA: Thivi_2564 family membrane protein [Bryobacteraceae bacterium]|jgi:predicted membrane protein